jgi:hypothetical protein
VNVDSQSEDAEDADFATGERSNLAEGNGVSHPGSEPSAQAVKGDKIDGAAVIVP